jgi:hypothetical protein
LLGSAGFPDGFIGLGVLAVLPIPLPVVVPVEVFGLVPIVGFPEPTVPEDVVADDAAPELAVPAEPPLVPVACASAAVLESASAAANANVVILIVVSFGRDRTNRRRRVRFRRCTEGSLAFA